MRWLPLKIKRLFARPASARPPARRRLELEALETRALPAGNATGTITGTAFIDANGDAARQANEVTLPGVAITLTGTTDQGNPVSVTATTDANGLFTFANVLPGSYALGSDTGTVTLGGSPNFGGQARTGDSVSGISVSGGQTVTQDLGFLGLAPEAVSIRLFLTNTTAADFAFPSAGSGQASAGPRANNAPVVSSPLQDVSVAANSSPTVLDLAGNFTDPDITDTMVALNTSAGTINIELFDTQAPRTVANFLNYLTSGAYNNSIFHRSAKLTDGTPFVLQGGGFTFNTNPSRLDPIPTDPAVQNEPDPVNRSNVLGTLAMAKLGNDPNSATDQFFFNLGDNSSNLNNQNGGFTVFGKVVSAADQQVVDTLAGIPTQNQGSAAALPASEQGVFTEIPLQNYTGTNFPTDTTAANYALIQGATISAQTESLTYSVVSNSNPSLVTTSIKDNRLTLTYAPGGTGSATITVRATDTFGATVDSTFHVTVGG
jgi:cyclophilin family peptidyl-prolyl cis-trans isomerase